MAVRNSKTKAKAESKAKAKTKAKDAKKTKQLIAKKIKQHKVGLVMLLPMCVIMCGVSIIFWNNLGKILEKDEKITELQQEYNHRRIQNDALQQKLDEEIDDEYIEEYAREQGYRKSDEIIFYIN